MVADPQPPFYKWFVGGRLNASYLALIGMSGVGVRIRLPLSGRASRLTRVVTRLRFASSLTMTCGVRLIGSRTY